MAAIFGYIGKVSRVNNLIYSGAAETRIISTLTAESNTVDFRLSSNSTKSQSYSYSDPETLPNLPENLGQVSASHSDSDDYGDVSQSTALKSDFGLIVSPLSSEPYGSINVGGSASYQPNYRNYINGSADYSVTHNPPESTVNILTFAQKESEKVIYDYSKDSINVLQTENYQLITSAHTDSDDFESITNSFVDVREDWGEVRYSDNIVPFGSMSISGSASYQPNYRNYVNGSAETTFSGSVFASGQLFAFDESASSISYLYTLEGSTIPSETKDYGSVSSSIDSGYEDYAYVADIVDGYEDYTLITDPLVSIVPFGGIGPLSGSAGITTRSLTSFFPPVTAIERATFVEYGFGTILSLSGLSESRLYNYDETDIVGNVDDNGLITSSEITFFDDYENVRDTANRFDNYGSVSEVISGISTTIYPLTSGTQITISGISLESATFPEIGSGNIPVLNGSAESISFREEENADIYEGGIRTITLTGSAVEKSQFEYVGTGTIPVLNGAAESITKDYNEDSAVTLVSDDYGLLTGSINTYLDWGLITDLKDGIDDYEFINELTSRVPFGSIQLSGNAKTEVYFLPYKFTGITSAIERVAWSPDDLGGSLYGFGNAAESRLYNYDDTDIVYFEQPDYGSIGIAATHFEDWGNVNTASDGTDDYQYLTGDPYFGIGTVFPLTQGTAITLSGTAIERESESYVGLGTIVLSQSGIESDVEVYVGLGTITLSGVAVEKNTESYIGLGTAYFSGTALESFSANTPEDTQLFVISGTAVEKNTESYVGLGTIVLSQSGIERDAEVYVGLGTITISGELNHPYIDYTPHYGIDKNIGIGTTGIQFSGLVDESAMKTFKASGLITLSDGLTESFTRYIPAEELTGVIRVSTGTSATRYYSPVYPRNALIGDPGSGIGTIRLNDDNGLTITRAILPYFASGGITISGSLNESFTPATHVGVGIVTISGDAETRPVQVYGYYGDDRDPGTSGNITISQQSALTIEKNTESYVGLGTITISETFDPRLTNAYESSGQITISGSANDAVVIPVSNTVLFQISGPKFSQESYTRTGYNGSGIITISGQVSDIRRTFGYEGSGTVTLSGDSVIRPAIKHIATGGFRFVSKYNVDNDYDTCDSDSITVDRISDADVSFTANPSETTILFNIGGNADTRVESDYLYVGSGFPTIYGGYSELKFVSAYSGIGSITLTSIAEEKEADVYVGLGTILAISGSSEVLSSQTPENTILLQIGGSASTKVESDYTYVGLGTEYLYGSASTRQIDVYTNVGSGVITLSGELVDPNVKFVPSPDGFGTISILGSSDEKFTRVVPSTGGTLFTLSSGFESFSRTTYVGLGTIYVVDASTSTINNPYQPPRVYVTII